jgi:hypothetical protein
MQQHLLDGGVGVHRRDVPDISLAAGSVSIAGVAAIRRERFGSSKALNARPTWTDAGCPE